MLRLTSFILLNSIAITLLGAWSAAYFFASAGSPLLLWLIGGAVNGFLYATVLLIVAGLFPNAFFAAFPAPKPKKS